MKKLVVVDMQRGFVGENHDFVDSLQKFVDKAGGVFDKTIATRFVNSADGPIFKCLNWDKMQKGTREIEVILNLPKNTKFVNKNTYALTEKAFKKLFKRGDEVYVCGMDFDACVLAICFQLLDHTIKPHIIWDLVASHSVDPAKKEELKKLYQKNFGKDSLILSKNI